MPSVSKKQHAFFQAISHSPSFAKRAGVAQSVGRDFVSADAAAGKFGKGKSMKNDMDGGAGMSPRKVMAGGTDKGDFGVSTYPGEGMGAHPDHSASTGTKGAMSDGERASTGSVHHSKGMLPAQANADHGPHQDRFMRGAKA